MNIKIKNIVLIFLISFLLLPISVFAKDEIELKVDKTDLTINDEIVVSASVPSGLDSYAIMATLKYDTNVFQMIDVDDFVVSQTETISYNKENNKFGIINRTGSIAQNGNLFSVHLKVKKDANVGDTNIALTNISSSDGKDKTTFPTTSVKVLVTRDAEKGESIPTNSENVITADKEKVMATFSNVPIIVTLIVVEVALLMASIYIYIYIYINKYKNMKSRKTLFYLLALEIVLLVIIFVLFIINFGKKDVNDDGKKDYDDAQEIIDYLIDIEGTKEQDETDSSNDSKPLVRPNSDYDTNNDGKVDVEDVGHVTEDVTDKSKVKLTEQSSDSDYYVNKGEITLKFKASITPKDVKVTRVKIGEEYYDVIYNNGIYAVKIQTPLDAGKYDFKITEVELDNGKVVETSLKMTREVLKDIPYVNKFNLDDEKKKLSFELVDDDSAFESGVVSIYDGSQKIASTEVKKGKTTITFEATEGKSYDVEIVGSYDLDSKRNDNKNSFDNAVMLTQEFTLGGDYNFTLTDVSITDTLQVGEVPVVSFKSTNNRNATIANANLTIKDKEDKNYNIVTRSGNNYEIQLEGADTTVGKHTVTLNNVGLTSLKTFYNGKDYEASTLTYTVLKEAPSIENLTASDDKDNKNIKVSFNLKDENLATKKLYVVIVDSLGKIVDKKEINKDDFISNKTVNVSLSYSNNVDGLYTVRVLADYELSDKYTYTDKKLDDTTILTHIDDIYISNMYVTNSSNKPVDNMFPTKNQKDFQVMFEVYVGDSIRSYAKTKYRTDYSQVSSITINGLNYPASKTSEYNSKVYFEIPSEAGKLTIKANRVQLTVDGYYNVYKTDMYSVKEKEITVDVLKDKPQIDNLVITDDYEKSQVTVDFDVILDETEKEENFNGEVLFDGKTMTSKAGKNHVVFKDVTKDKNMDLTFTGNYDLDSDLENDKNLKTKDELLKVTYGLYSKDTYEKIAIENGRAISNNNDRYFEKNEKIKLYFDISNIDEMLDNEPSKVVIDDKEYDITKTANGYELVLEGYHASGEKEIVVTDIILNNGKKITLNKSYTFNPEVLKDVVLVKDFRYEELKDSIKVTFNLKDSDNSLLENKIKITTEDGKVVYEKDYQNEITFTKEKDVLRYNVYVIATYDRDIDIAKGSDNHKENAVILKELISLDKNNIEFKNIKDVNLYKVEEENGSEKITIVNEISESELNQNLESYFVEVVMEQMPTVRAKIKEVKNVDDRLILILDYDYVTKEGDKNNQIIRIDFGRVKENGKASNETHPEDAFRALLEELKNEENVTLTHDYDAKGVEVEGNTYVEKELTGTLNGNGFTIKNLTKPLYPSVNGGTVENLRLKNVNMAVSNGNGTIAISATNATFDRIFIDEYKKSINVDDKPVGVIVGTAKSSTIKNCRVTNFTIDSGGWANRQQIGGLIGQATDTNVLNSYAAGSIIGGWNFRAGLVGYASGGTYENNYANVYLNSGMSRGNICGIACKGDNATFKNNLSLSYGVIDYPISQGRKESVNNYYIGSSTDPDSKVEDEHKITDSDITNELFSETLNFSSKDWYINNVSKDNLPILQAERSSIVDGKDNSDYDETKENLYSNLLKLMPFYDSDKIIDLAKNVKDSLLIDDVITHIAPVFRDGNLVTYLTKDNVKEINKIKIVYKSGKKEEFNVSYDKTYDMVATYKIVGLNIDYNYNHYVIDSSSQVVNNLTNYLKGLDYTNNLDIITINEDSRIYRDFYNETTKNELKDFVLKYLANSNYTNTTNDEGVNSYIEREVKKDKRIEKVLYVYNYFRRFYDLDIDGMKVYDFVMFNMQGFDESLTPEKIADLYLGDFTGDNFNTNQTDTRYINVLSGYTEKSHISYFLEYIVTHFSNYDMSEWVANQFKGILVEIPVKDHPEIQYTLWDHFSNVDFKYRNNYAVFNYVLPILTLPEDAAYLISAPAQFTIGALRVYMSNPNDVTQLAKFETKMKAYTDRIESYYNTAYAIIEDPQIFNDIHLYQIDKRTTKNENGMSVYNTPYSTTEPFHKNFDEVVNVWPATYGVNAGNWGDRIEWNVAGFMDTDIKTDGTLDNGHPTFMTWSHESAHYLDDRLFLKYNGRRFDSGGEDYADALFMQEFSALGIVMNLTVNYKKDLEVASNLTPERINSPLKIQEFYSRMFDTIYLLDYIEAKAFLQLDREEQKMLGVQISYPNVNAEVKFVDKNGKEYPDFVRKPYIEDEYAKYRAYHTTKYTPLRKVDNFDDIKLDSIDDLIDNKIMLYPGIFDVSTRGDNRYGGEGINTVHWYQPNNPYGRPDSYSLKWISYEMLGYAGYDKGFIGYASNINSEKKTIYSSLSIPVSESGQLQLTDVNYKSDAMALEDITDGKYTDFDTYKKDRFKEVEEKLERLNNVVNVKEYVQLFYDALKQDVITSTKDVDKLFSERPNCLDDLYYCINPRLIPLFSYPESTEVRKEIYYKLKNYTDDFRSDIYEDSWQQDVDDLTVNK